MRRTLGLESEHPGQDSHSVCPQDTHPMEHIEPPTSSIVCQRPERHLESSLGCSPPDPDQRTSMCPGSAKSLLSSQLGPRRDLIPTAQEVLPEVNCFQTSWPIGLIKSTQAPCFMGEQTATQRGAVACLRALSS